jgi:hypothetical protein
MASLIILITVIARYSALGLTLFRNSALAFFLPSPSSHGKYTAFLYVYTTAVCKLMAGRQ